MELSPEQQSFVDAIRKPKHKHRAVQLEKRFSAVSRDERLDLLLYLFSERNDYVSQHDCSPFLPRVIAECTLPLEDILKRVAPCWNLSVEQLPYFLADAYGADTVVEIARALATQYGEDSYERRSLGTIVWWLERRRNISG